VTPPVFCIISLGVNVTINAIGEPNEFVMPGTNSTAVEIEYELSVSVREDIYDYMNADEKIKFMLIFLINMDIIFVNE
jgi:hypothetical protein